MIIRKGSNRLVFILKKNVYKIGIGKRGRLANKIEYEKSLSNKFCAKTEKKWYGLKQEKLSEICILPACIKEPIFPKEWIEMWPTKLNSRFQVGKDKNGEWKYFDYEDAKPVFDKMREEGLIK